MNMITVGVAVVWKSLCGDGGWRVLVCGDGGDAGGNNTCWRVYTEVVTEVMLVCVYVAIIKVIRTMCSGDYVQCT